MAAQEILVLFVEVRILLLQQNVVITNPRYFFKVSCCHRTINELVSILYLGNSIIAVIEFGNAGINKITPYLY